MTAPAVCVQVEVPTDEADLASERLWGAGAAAIEERAAGAGRVLLVAGVPGGDPAVLVAGLEGRWRAEVVEVASDAWMDAWRPWATAVRAGPVVVRPPWVEVEPAPGEVVITIDPTRAFGSGSHPSTRLALAAVAAHVRPRTSVLDVGCGSGVLAVAAAVLGAHRVVAVDVDPLAVATTAANAAANGVADRVGASTHALADVDGVFDLVVANIGADILRGLAPALAARVAPGGALVLSGLLDERADEVAATVPGLVPDGAGHEDGWAAPVLRRPAPGVATGRTGVRR